MIKRLKKFIKDRYVGRYRRTVAFFKSKKVGKFQKIWVVFGWIVSIIISLVFIVLDLTLFVLSMILEALSNLSP